MYFVPSVSDACVSKFDSDFCLNMAVPLTQVACVLLSELIVIFWNAELAMRRIDVLSLNFLLQV